MAQLDQDNRFEPTDIDKALGRVKFPASTGPVLQVIQGIRDFEVQLLRAMKGISLACVLYAKLLLHGDMLTLNGCNLRRLLQNKKSFLLIRKMWKKDSCKRWKVGYMHRLVDVAPKDIQNTVCDEMITYVIRKN